MTTVRSEWQMCCPHCGDDTQLDIAAIIDVRLNAHGTDPDEASDGSHIWDNESQVMCATCNWSGIVEDCKRGFKRFQWNVTYDVVTEASAQYGDVAERGFVDRHLSLREAFETALEARAETLLGEIAAEARDSDESRARWVGFTHPQEIEGGAVETRSVHIPEHVTPASRARIVRLLTSY